MIETDKLILDATCATRSIWFDKENEDTLFIDIREESKGFMADRPNTSIEPDIVMDYRDLQFADKTFQLVVWDPPHIARYENKSWIQQKYGMLHPDTWKEDLAKGFRECYRVLRDHGVLIFKWSEPEIKVSEVLELFDAKPLFGHTTGRGGKTKWVCFMKKA